MTAQSQKNKKQKKISHKNGPILLILMMCGPLEKYFNLSVFIFYKKNQWEYNIYRNYLNLAWVCVLSELLHIFSLLRYCSVTQSEVLHRYPIFLTDPNLTNKYAKLYTGKIRSETGSETVRWGSLTIVKSGLKPDSYCTHVFSSACLFNVQNLTCWIW